MAPRGTSRRIAEELRSQIQDGTLEAGSMLPSEHKLAERYRVARGTVRAAMEQLASDKLIEVLPGRGRRVCGRPVVTVATTAYERIADDIRNRITENNYSTGDPLPSESNITAEYGVSRNTARRAYRLLEESGMIVILHGSGVFVR